MFELHKWYLDLITDDGTAAIFYAARLRAGSLRVAYAATLLAERSAERESATLRDVALPGLDGDVATWESGPLQVRGRWCRDAPAIERTLADGPDGAILWTCHMPRARASVDLGGRRLEGLGYVESLRLTVAPWRLPFHALRWGRHTSSAHSLVWIDWDAGERGRWVWLDGVEQPGAVPCEAGVRLSAVGAELRLQERRVVRDRRVFATISDILPDAARRLAGPLAGMHERKWLSRSAVVGAESPPDRGWTLHETVTW